MKKNTAVTVVLVSIPLIIGGYFIWKSFNKPPSGEGDGSGDNKKTDTIKKDEIPPSKFPLKKGSTGAEVIKLQNAIGVSNLPKYGADGKFGDETEKMVVRYLKKKTVDSYSDINEIIACNDSFFCRTGKALGF